MFWEVLDFLYVEDFKMLGGEMLLTEYWGNFLLDFFYMGVSV